MEIKPMFVDLEKTKMNTKVSLTKNLTDGDTISFKELGKTFTFRNNPSEENDIEIKMTEPTYASGSVKSFNKYSLRANDYINIGDKFGVSFSNLGSFDAVLFKENCTTDDFVRITIGEEIEYKFKFGNGNPEPNTVYVNLGYTKTESAHYLAQAINEYMNYYGIDAYDYEDTIVLNKMFSRKIASNKNAFSLITFADVASISDSFSFQTKSGNDLINHIYRFGVGIGYINPGYEAIDSAYNLAKAINDDKSKPAVALAIDNKVYLYSTTFGSNGNTKTYCNTSGKFNATDFKDGSDSEVNIEFNNSSIFGIKKIACAVSTEDDDYRKGMASIDAAIYSLSDSLQTKFDYINYMSEIKYTEAGKNLSMFAYGGDVLVSGITGAVPSTVDTEETTSNLCDKLNQYSSYGIEASRIESTAKIDFDYAETITSSDTEHNKFDIINWSKGTKEEPLSWNELTIYKESLGINKALVNLDIVFIKGSLKQGITPISFDGYSESTINLSTLDKSIEYGGIYPLVFNNCDRLKIFISGKFKNTCDSFGEVGFIKVSNSYSVTCSILNCENTHLGKDSKFIKLDNCSMESSLLINHSTFTQGDSADNGQLMSVSGYVSVKSKYCVFEGKNRSNCVVYLGSNCYYNSYRDCFSKISPASSMSSFNPNESRGLDETDESYDNKIVIDTNNEEPWSLNLVPNSIALLIGEEDYSAPDDINGNKRYLETNLRKTTVVVNQGVVGNGKFLDTNYIEIDGVRKFFGDELPKTFESEADFANEVRDAFLSSKYKIEVSASSSEVSFSMYGKNDLFRSNIGDCIEIKQDGQEPNGVDAGSRQNHTIIKKSYKVDLSADERTEEYITLSDMENIVKSSFPCYGEMTFNLENSNSENQEIELGYDTFGNLGEGYCDFKFIGVKVGKKYVPTLKANLKFASKKYNTFYFDGIIHIGSIEEAKNETISKTIIDVIFVNSILIWDSSNILSTLRVIESTVVEKTAGAIITVAKEFIVSGCIIKCKFKQTGTEIKAIERCDYIIDGYTTDFSTDAEKIDREGTEIGEDCLVNSSGTTIDDFAIVEDSKAISFIDGTYKIDDLYSSITDIVGNYRCSENVKDSLDCGAYESKIVFAKSLNIVVNLDSEATGNGGKYAPCSLKEAYDKINSLEKIDMPIYIEISGYGTDIPKFETTKRFSDSGSINFIGEPNTTIDGGIEETTFLVEDDNALISFSNIIIRDCVFDSNAKKIVFASCALINTKEDTLIKGNGKCYFYGCSLQTKTNPICENESFVIGCSAQSETDISIFENENTSSGNVCYNCSIQDATLLDSQIMNDAINTEIISSELFKLVNDEAIGLVSIADFGDLYEDAESYNYNEDIRGFYRFDENENTDGGCYDSLGSNDAGSYTDKPNGQFASITKEGSSLITRMLTGKLRFKIIGYSVGKGGYSKRNPVNSLPYSCDGVNAKYIVSLNSNNLTREDGIKIGSLELRATIDFNRESSTEETTYKLVKCINEKNGSFYAEQIDENSFYMTAISLGESGNGAVISIGNNFQIIQTVVGTNANYGIDICYPSEGYKEFEFVDHIPFAVSFYLRLDRKEIQSALGEVIVYAKIVKSELPNEEGTNVPFAVIRHGLITKDKDSVVVRRIVVQV